MHKLFPILIALLLSAPSLGCGDDSPPVLSDSSTGDGGADGSTDGGPGTDSGPGADGGPGDTGTPIDSGAPTDAAMDTGPVSMPCTAIGPCDPFDPTSCADGEGCQPGIGMTECVTLDPAAGDLGETCALPDECAAGLLCLNFGDGPACERMCPNGSIGFCGAGQGCSGAIGGDMCIRICRSIPTPCDIFAQDCAGTDEACTLARNPETREPYTGCRPAGTQGRGMACGGTDGQCQAGLICLGEAGINACRQVCGPDGGDPTCSDPGEACTGMSTTWMVPYCR
ncbi:MAG: hypothetical protein JRH11_24340 [Deltaproteobacteria bacterium]|nr:hypothetical protein [Deltaproteobacteria bacterium]